MKNNFSCSRNRSLLPPYLEIMNKRPMIVLFWIEIHTWYTSYCIHCIPNLWAATEWPTHKKLWLVLKTKFGWWGRKSGIFPIFRRMPYTFIFKAQLPAKIHTALTSNLQLKSKKIPLIHSFRANDVAVYYSCINLCNLGSMQIPPSSSTLKHSNIVMHWCIFQFSWLHC